MFTLDGVLIFGRSFLFTNEMNCGFTLCQADGMVPGWLGAYGCAGISYGQQTQAHFIDAPEHAEIP